MKTLTALLLLSLVPLASVAQADAPQPSQTCRATPWPFSRAQHRRELLKQIKALDRATAVEYYFGELTQPPQGGKGRSVAEPLGFYLTQTELDPDLRLFYKFLAEGAELESKPASPRILKLPEVCEVYGKVLAFKGGRR